MPRRDRAAAAPGSRPAAGALAAAALLALAGILLAAACQRDEAGAAKATATRPRPGPTAPDVAPVARQEPNDTSDNAAPTARPAPIDAPGDAAPVASSANATDGLRATDPASPSGAVATAPAGTPDAAPAPGDSDFEPVVSEGDVVVEAQQLGFGTVRRVFEVAEACPLGRVELDVGVNSMPDGSVTLTAPSGRSARLRLRALQIDFVKTWDWAALEDLHDERGTPMAGTWVFESRLRGADYSQSATGETAPMPVPDVTVVRLRLFCEPRRGAPSAWGDAGDGVRLDEWTARWAPGARRPRPGADARALVAVRRDCTLGGVVADLELGFRTATEGRVRLVEPDGTTHDLGRVLAHAGVDRPGRHRFSRTLPLERGPRAAGLWELVFREAGADDSIEAASLRFLCAAP